MKDFYSIGSCLVSLSLFLTCNLATCYLNDFWTNHESMYLKESSSEPEILFTFRATDEFEILASFVLCKIRRFLLCTNTLDSGNILAANYNFLVWSNCCMHGNIIFTRLGNEAFGANKMNSILRQLNFGNFENKLRHVLLSHCLMQCSPTIQYLTSLFMVSNVIAVIADKSDKKFVES